MKYFFHLAGAVQDPDDAGYEFATLADARIEAAKFAGEYLRERPEVAWTGDEFRIEVTNSEQTLLFTFVAIGVDAPAGTGK